MKFPQTAAAVTVLALLAASTVSETKVNQSAETAGQSATQPDRRYIFSVRRNTSGATTTPFALLPAGGFSATNYPLRTLIILGYQLQDTQLEAPQWTRTERFDAIAKAEIEDSPPDGPSARITARLLLSERFKLKFHREMRQQPSYTLITRNANSLGPKLKGSARSCSPFATASSASSPPCGVFSSAQAAMHGEAVTMAQLARLLAGVVQRNVVDGTELEGTFDLDLSFSLVNSRTPTAATGDDAPDVFTALKEQLGLELKADTAPVEVVVVDHIERPDPD